MIVTQRLSMEVLKNEENVRAVWSEYKQNGDTLTKSLQMFEDILNHPIQEIHEFLHL